MNRTAPSTLIAALALLVLLGVALAAGCASTPSGSAATTTPTPAGTTAATTAAAAVTTAGTSGSGSTAVAVVSADRLAPFIPKTAGAWKLDGEAQKITTSDGEGQNFVMATGEYVKDSDDKASANVMILDSAVAKTPYKEQWGSFRSVETNDGWYRSVTVKGQPGWRSYAKSSNDYAEWVLAGDRYIVVATVQDGSEADLDALVNAIDFAGLAAVK
ncbi:MAG TPA: hypothetical protein HA263_10855 [Methanoregulaceae archaeon]|nr:hypothetical protein [Methanoregulaceae archaeon]